MGGHSELIKQRKSINLAQSVGSKLVQRISRCVSKSQNQFITEWQYSISFLVSWQANVMSSLGFRLSLRQTPMRFLGEKREAQVSGFQQILRVEKMLLLETLWHLNKSP